MGVYAGFDGSLSIGGESNAGIQIINCEREKTPDSSPYWQKCAIFQQGHLSKNSSASCFLVAVGRGRFQHAVTRECGSLIG